MASRACFEGNKISGLKSWFICLLNAIPRFIQGASTWRALGAINVVLGCSNRGGERDQRYGGESNELHVDSTINVVVLKLASVH